jgi:hypothetical protein
MAFLPGRQVSLAADLSCYDVECFLTQVQLILSFLDFRRSPNEGFDHDAVCLSRRRADFSRSRLSSVLRDRNHGVEARAIIAGVWFAELLISLPGQPVARRVLPRHSRANRD